MHQHGQALESGKNAKGKFAPAGKSKEDWVANQLRRVYDEALHEDVPDEMLSLLSKLDDNGRNGGRDS